jgi:tRNA 2-selenouridine synthase
MSDHIVTSEQFKNLFLADTPFLDVRAEVEFSKGGFPTSKNIPILNDIERELVGTRYKNNGKEAAVALGHKLVSGETKDQRIKAWCDFAKANKNTHIYCWRGGMRSNFARQWMSDAGVDIPLIDGGFKALRRLLIDTIDMAAAEQPMLRIGGKTGTAKTVLVNTIPSSIDLEGHANHRGSSFGRRVSGSPTQIEFENTFGIDLLRKLETFQNQTLIVEDESRSIGPCTIPKAFFNKMHESNLAVVETSIEVRMQHIIQEYVIEMTQEFLDAHTEDGWNLFVEYLTQSLARAQKRLGTENYKKIAALMDSALNTQKQTADTGDHEGWVRALLNDYYDPMYEYQLDKKSEKIAFRGSYDEVLDWAQEQSHSSH